MGFAHLLHRHPNRKGTWARRMGPIPVQPAAIPRKSSESESPAAPPKVKVTRETLGEMFGLYTYLRPYRGRLYVGLFMLVTSTVLGLFFPLLASVMINSKTHEEAFRTALLMVVILLAQGIMS